jgi:SAM-dependent methyltransferase
LRHTELYQLPYFYEIAFSYRNIPRECDFLQQVYGVVTGRPPASVLELACGPGLHVREFAQRGLRVAALDLSPEMVAYVASHLPPAPDDRKAELQVANMADFRLRRPVDLAFNLVGSISYLTSNAEFVQHFRAVAKALNPGGVYVVETFHPRGFWCGRQPSSRWTEERDGVRVTTHWAKEWRRYPSLQVNEVLCELVVERPGLPPEVVETWGRLRALLPQEMLALVELAGGLQFAGWWGGFDLSQNFDDSRKSWRLIAAFQKPVG